MSQHQQNPRAPPNAPTNQPPPLPPPPNVVFKCPRCDSSNTKFCYYNNYSLAQPRYFCKACRRYWTQGGTLRNVPVGGGCRKGSKRAKASTSTAVTTSTCIAATSSYTQLPTGTTASPPIMSTTSTHYYPSLGGSFLPSLAAIHASLGQQQLDLGEDGGSSSGLNMGFFQGLGISPAAQILRGPQPHPPTSLNNEWINQAFLSNPRSNNDNVGSNNVPIGSASSSSFWGQNSTSGANATDSVPAGDADSAGGAPLMNQNQWLGPPGYIPPQ
ncbi:hypothetical protein SAY86_007136 [Trapa natans]|uniref:Dof zinc finger protein n=1 Tax=Trapa natans TaxID=22666 RepID=A0AAN7QXK4_TRANT|nr:hypothetical protein SAY86_007136 [Trapa natans]